LPDKAGGFVGAPVAQFKKQFTILQRTMFMAQRNGNRTASGGDEVRLARALGWFSIALGLAGILAPRRLGKMAGVGSHPTLLRLLGFRELASGIGILTQPRPTGWLQARVAGDVMDLALLGSALASSTSRPARVIAASAAVAGVAALDVKCSRQLKENPAANISLLHFKRTLIIDRSPEELYRFWRAFENLPRFMNHLESVRTTGDKTSHWVAKGPAGTRVEWDAEITRAEPNSLIAWRSVAGSDVDNAGSVRFSRATGNRGTVVAVEIQYDPPAGVLGATVAKLFGEAPEKQVKVDLLRFKQLIETGEIARTEGQPAGRPHSTSRKYDDFIRA
jgi:uncharacterized membrane protein